MQGQKRQAYLSCLLFYRTPVEKGALPFTDLTANPVGQILAVVDWGKCDDHFYFRKLLEMKNCSKEIRIRWKTVSLSSNYDWFFSSSFCANNLVLLEMFIVKRKKKQLLYYLYWLKMSPHLLVKWPVCLWMAKEVFSVSVEFGLSPLRINHNWCLSSFSVHFLITFVSISGVIIRCKILISSVINL